MSKSNKISVILPYYNKSRQIFYTLKSLEKQTRKPDEVIIIDDGSKKRFHLEKDFNLPLLRIIRLKPSNYRTSVFAMNEGIREATGNIIVLTSAETIQGKNNLEYIEKFVSKDQFVVGKNIYFEAPINKIPHQIKLNPEGLLYMNIEKYHKGFVWKRENTYLQTGMTNGIYGILKETLLKINGFDEEAAYWGCNDSNFNDRLKKLGIKMFSHAGIFGVHQFHSRPPKKHMQIALAMRDITDRKSQLNYRCKKGIYG